MLECLYGINLLIVWKKREKLNSLSGFPCLDSIARAAGRKNTSSRLNLVAVLLGLRNEKVSLMPASIASLKVRNLSEREVRR